MKSLPPFILFALLAASISRADIIRVPTDYETIQSAIEAAVAGDTIDVSAGTYQERLVLKPGIVVRSVGGNEKGKLGLTRAEITILDGGGANGEAPGVTMAAGATLDGFTITRVGLYDEDSWKKHWDEQGENQSHARIGTSGKPAIAITGLNCTV
ncbi:MAG: hypothetical protein ABF370_06870, partial [Verrucomicrobiales bacterium]